MISNNELGSIAIVSIPIWSFSRGLWRYPFFSSNLLIGPDWFLFEEFSNYLRDENPKLIRGTSKKFGITGLKKLCELAKTSNTNCEIGTGGNIFMNMANLHVMMTIKNCNFYEYWMPTWAHDFACIETIELDENSEITAPIKPGIGLTLNEDWIKNHKVATLV